MPIAARCLLLATCHAFVHTRLLPHTSSLWFCGWCCPLLLFFFLFLFFFISYIGQLCLHCALVATCLFVRVPLLVCMLDALTAFDAGLATVLLRLFAALSSTRHIACCVCRWARYAFAPLWYMHTLVYASRVRSPVGAILS